MAVFRVNKTKDYTVMSNYHLRDRSLTCKACGLLSKMLSLPDEWDYTTRGLACLCKDGVDAIGTALKELEKAGYLVRNRLRDEKGRITDTEYVIYERPQLPPPEPEKPDTPPPAPAQPDTAEPEPDTPDTTGPDTGKPDIAYPYPENPYMADPDTEEPRPENPAQLNNNKQITKKSITISSNTHSFFPSGAAPSADGLTDGRTLREEIKEKIEYDVIATPADRRQIDELVEIMVEVELNRSPTIKIGRDQEYSSSYVRDRFAKIGRGHIEKVLEGIQENTTRVWNTKAYLLAALFNSVSTLDSHYTMLVHHDMSGSP